VRMDLGKVGKGELGAMLAEHLGELSPQDQATIKRIAAGQERPADVELSRKRGR